MAVPAGLLALQIYSPLSVACTGDKVRLLLGACWIRGFAETGVPFLSHVTTGRGSPVATQSNTALNPCTEVTLAAGVIITGTPASGN